jgi:hypothetical protein
MASAGSHFMRREKSSFTHNSRHFVDWKTRMGSGMVKRNPSRVTPASTRSLAKTMAALLTGLVA